MANKHSWLLFQKDIHTSTFMAHFPALDYQREVASQVKAVDFRISELWGFAPFSRSSLMTAPHSTPENSDIQILPEGGVQHSSVAFLGFKYLLRRCLEGVFWCLGTQRLRSWTPELVCFRMKCWYYPEDLLFGMMKYGWWMTGIIHDGWNTAISWRYLPWIYHDWLPFSSRARFYPWTV